MRCGVASPSVTIAVDSCTFIERWYACAARSRSRVRMPVDTRYSPNPGSSGIAAGIGIVLFRDQVAARNRANLEKRVDRWFPGFSAGSTPSRMVSVGLLAVLIGVVVILKATIR